MHEQVILIMGIVLALGCRPNDGIKKTPVQSYVTFLTPSTEVAVTVEIADTPEAQRRGLMFRRELGPYNGMLFVFDEERQHTFWMQNTYLPLDLVFIDGDHKVAGIVANAEPLSEAPLRVDRPSRYVVEVNAGFAAKHHITSGCSIRLPVGR